MSDFRAFMKQNAIVIENEKFVASKRFLSDEPELDKKGKPIVIGKDESGKDVYKMKPIEWEIKAIPSKLDEQIRTDCTKRIPISGKRGQTMPELNMDEYLAKLCAACTVYPNLNDAELQDSYGVRSADALIREMLTAGEYTEYKAKIAEINGFDVSIDDKVEEAKN